MIGNYHTLGRRPRHGAVPADTPITDQPPRPPGANALASSQSVLPDSAREVLASDGLAHLVTLNPDGSPQVSCVWVGLEGDEIVCAHLGRFQKVKNIERDPRVTLSVEAPGENAIGMKHYLVVHGKARITEGGAPELAEARGDVRRAWCEVPADARSAAGGGHPNHPGARRRHGPWAASPT